MFFDCVESMVKQ